ncbi:ArsR/SmtB family transcription factor [Pseudoroseicyclus tamaricis]|uniref:Helix-turn-helix transcriptional regulator n=1 Tax=Pseudoroseicyclus tamaricis TaxID=2705421 RepID=A0A6B2JW91_9RHOB|nr:metalloregulator ArsR/SmtB family transcription factor [Pseudoroseicyclus tamaricis]NDV02175.1 helix-turn-helix transcriptional regulator [Pseudoroseicyclus tamaricis]
MPKQPDLDQTFHALADPTRRAVLSALAEGEKSVGDLAAPFGMALPSFMQHLKVLEEGQLIRTEKRGRRRMCRLDPARFAEAKEWMEAEHQRWTARLGRLGAYLDRKDNLQ